MFCLFCTHVFNFPAPAWKVVQVKSELLQCGQKLKGVAGESCQQVGIQIPAKFTRWYYPITALPKQPVIHYNIAQECEMISMYLQYFEIRQIFESRINARQLIVVNLIKINSCHYNEYGWGSRVNTIVAAVKKTNIGFYRTKSDFYIFIDQIERSMESQVHKIKWSPGAIDSEFLTFNTVRLVRDARVSWSKVANLL